MWVTVPEIPPESLSSKGRRSNGETKAARERIEAARARQLQRFDGESHLTTNADMHARDIEQLAGLEPDAEQALIDAARRLKLSPRGYHRTIKLARTIADLAGSEKLKTPHMLEALQYRSREV